MIQQFQSTSKHNGKRAAQKNKLGTKTLSVEERQDAQARIFRLLQQEQFARKMKFLMAEREIPKILIKILQFSPFIDQQGLIHAQGRIGKSQMILKASILNCYIRGTK